MSIVYCSKEIEWSGLKRAIESLKPGDELVVGEGLWRGDSPIEPPSGVTIRGAPGAEIEVDSAAHSGFQIQARDGVTLSDLRLVDSSDVTQRDDLSARSLILIVDCNDTTVARCHLEIRNGRQFSGLRVLVSSGVQVKNVTILGGYEGLSFDSSKGRVEDTHCANAAPGSGMRFSGNAKGDTLFPSYVDVTDCSSNDNAAAGILFRNGATGLIENCVCDNSKTRHGICVEGQLQSAVSSDPIIRENKCRGNCQNGIFVSAGTVHLENNECVSNQAHGICVKNDETALQFPRDEIVGDISHSNDEHGILVHSVNAALAENRGSAHKMISEIVVAPHGSILVQRPKVTLIRNLCYENAGCGILIESTAARIEHNACWRNDGRAGITADMERVGWSAHPDVSINRNICFENAAVGIEVCSARADICDNECWLNYRGIWAGRHESISPSLVFIRGNKCYSNTHSGIVVYESTGTIEGNECFDNKEGPGILIGDNATESNAESGARMVNVVANQSHHNHSDGVLSVRCKVTVKGNQCWESKFGSGIRLLSQPEDGNVSSLSTIEANRCYQNASSGITLSTSLGIVEGNDCWQNKGSGIRCEDELPFKELGSRMINRNRCDGNTEYGIDLASASAALYNNEAWNNDMGPSSSSSSSVAIQREQMEQPASPVDQVLYERIAARQDFNILRLLNTEGVNEVEYLFDYVRSGCSECFVKYWNSYRYSGARAADNKLILRPLDTTSGMEEELAQKVRSQLEQRDKTPAVSLEQSGLPQNDSNLANSIRVYDISVDSGHLQVVRREESGSKTMHRSLPGQIASRILDWKNEEPAVIRSAIAFVSASSDGVEKSVDRIVSQRSEPRPETAGTASSEKGRPRMSPPVVVEPVGTHIEPEEEYDFDKGSFLDDALLQHPDKRVFWLHYISCAIVCCLAVGILWQYQGIVLPILSTPLNDPAFPQQLTALGTPGNLASALLIGAGAWLLVYLLGTLVFEPGKLPARFQSMLSVPAWIAIVWLLLTTAFSHTAFHLVFYEIGKPSISALNWKQAASLLLWLLASLAFCLKTCDLFLPQALRFKLPASDFIREFLAGMAPRGSSSTLNSISKLVSPLDHWAEEAAWARWVSGRLYGLRMFGLRVGRVDIATLFIKYTEYLSEHDRSRLLMTADLCPHNQGLIVVVHMGGLSNLVSGYLDIWLTPDDHKACGAISDMVLVHDPASSVIQPCSGINKGGDQEALTNKQQIDQDDMEHSLSELSTLLGWADDASLAKCYYSLLDENWIIDDILPALVLGSTPSMQMTVGKRNVKAFSQYGRELLVELEPYSRLSTGGNEEFNLDSAEVGEFWNAMEAGRGLALLTTTTKKQRRLRLSGRSGYRLQLVRALRSVDVQQSEEIERYIPKLLACGEFYHLQRLIDSLTNTTAANHQQGMLALMPVHMEAALFLLNERLSFGGEEPPELTGLWETLGEQITTESVQELDATVASRLYIAYLSGLEARGLSIRDSDDWVAHIIDMIQNFPGLEHRENNTLVQLVDMQLGRLGLLLTLSPATEGRQILAEQFGQDWHLAPTAMVEALNRVNSESECLIMAEFTRAKGELELLQLISAFRGRPWIVAASLSWLAIRYISRYQYHGELEESAIDSARINVARFLNSARDNFGTATAVTFAFTYSEDQSLVIGKSSFHLLSDTEGIERVMRLLGEPLPPVLPQSSRIELEGVALGAHGPVNRLLSANEWRTVELARTPIR